MKRFLIFVLAALLIVPFTVSAQDDVVELTMGSWRTEDIEQWDNILEVFHAQYPNIRISFEPTLNTEYDAQLRNQLEGSVGPDLITCRPFDRALLNYEIGGLADISDLEGLENFSDVALSAWSTDDGSATYCVPMASVIHGFIYNKTLFDELGLEVPTNESEFFAVLDALAAAGETPIAISTKDAWTTSTMGFNNLWPAFCDGEATRQAIIAGEATFTDECFIETYETLAAWEPYMPEGHESIGYADVQQIFPLGLAAIYPSGSWEIPLFNDLADFELGAFRPYGPDGSDACAISDHVDIAIGMNANTEHPEEARTFLEWLTTQEFAQIFSDNQPGFFSLSTHPVELADPLAAEFVSWRADCDQTIRMFDQFLSRGEPGGNQLMNETIPLLVQGELSPEEVGDIIQSGLEDWYYTDE
ncbi:MAG: ABC transporter substrate-binding protein [Anaerolineae bacterium]